MKLKREVYLQQIRPFYEVDLIKVITGIRRSGKSILLETIKDEIISNGTSGDHIIFLNLEDLDYEYIDTASQLNKEIKSRIIDNSKYYIFIDEIQHIKEFEKALASFRATLNVSIFVTGSNSTLLSGELATLLTGRTVEFEVFPFTFFEMKQYFELNNMDYNDDLIYDYIKWGGFPLRFDFHREEDIKRYLNTLYDNIINRDIKKKSPKFDIKLFRELSLYILANAGKDFSVEKIINFYKSNKNKTINKQTLYNYINRMEKAFLIHPIKKYNISGKSAFTGNDKFYATDMGLRIINTDTINYKDTFFLENIIYNELLARGYTVLAGKTYKSEVDFIAIKEGKKCFIQVSYFLSSKTTIEREFGAFSPISDSSPKYVMSLDKLDMSQNGIAHINIIDFLLYRKNIYLT